MRAAKAQNKYLIRGAMTLAVGLGAAILAQPAQASEYGLSTYPLGSQTSMTGFTPPPGLYVTDTVIVYQGDAADKIDVPLGARMLCANWPLSVDRTIYLARRAPRIDTIAPQTTR